MTHCIFTASHCLLIPASRTPHALMQLPTTTTTTRGCGWPRVLVVLSGVVLAAVMCVVKAMEPSVFMFTSPALGTFMVARGKLLTTTDACKTLTVTSLCMCKTACWMDLKCVAASVSDKDTGDGTMECRMAMEGPTNTTLLDQPDSTYIFWNDSIPAKIYEVTQDGLLTLLGNQPMSFGDSKLFCSRIPGHRLAMSKTTQQIKALLDIHNRTNGKEFWVHLVHFGQESAPILWGDGTPIENTPAGNVVHIQTDSGHNQPYRMHKGMFNDLDWSKLRLPACQANPLADDEW